jgi:hypothetical protein
MFRHLKWWVLHDGPNDAVKHQTCATSEFVAQSIDRMFGFACFCRHTSARVVENPARIRAAEVSPSSFKK